jgi:hypothetical protein
LCGFQPAHRGSGRAVEAGGMAKRRLLEELHECLMPGIILPPRKLWVWLSSK